MKKGMLTASACANALPVLLVVAIAWMFSVATLGAQGTTEAGEQAGAPVDAGVTTEQADNADAVQASAEAPAVTEDAYRSSEAWQSYMDKLRASDAEAQSAERAYRQGRLSLDLMDNAQQAQLNLSLGSGGLSYTNDDNGTVSARPGVSLSLPSTGTSINIQAPFSVQTKHKGAQYGAGLGFSQAIISPVHYESSLAQAQRDQQALLVEQAYQQAKLDAELRLYKVYREVLEAEQAVGALEAEGIKLLREDRKLKTEGYDSTSAQMQNLELKKQSLEARKAVSDRSLKNVERKLAKLIGSEDVIGIALPMPRFADGTQMAQFLARTPSMNLQIADLSYRIADLEAQVAKAKEAFQLNMNMAASTNNQNWKKVAFETGLKGSVPGVDMGAYVKFATRENPLVAGIELSYSPFETKAGVMRREQAAMRGADARMLREQASENYTQLASELEDAVALWQLDWKSAQLSVELAKKGYELQQKMYDDGFASQEDVLLAELEWMSAQIERSMTQMAGLELEIKVIKALEL